MGHVASMGERLSPYMLLVGKIIRKRALGRRRRRWEDNIKIYLQGLRWVAGKGLIGLRIWADICLL